MREFLKATLSEGIRRKRGARAVDCLRWQRLLYVQVWGGPSWLQKFSGTGWSRLQQYIFEEKSAATGAPRVRSCGTRMVMPALMAFGSSAQQDRGTRGCLYFRRLMVIELRFGKSNLQPLPRNWCNQLP